MRPNENFKVSSRSNTLQSWVGGKLLKWNLIMLLIAATQALFITIRQHFYSNSEMFLAVCLQPSLLQTWMFLFLTGWSLPKLFSHSSPHPPFCAAEQRASERRGGAASWGDNVRRLSNPASVTPPLAGLLDYQTFAASVTSAGLFTMETPHHFPPTAPHHRATAASRRSGSSSPEPRRFRSRTFPCY